jgi:hypothetical protein
MHELGYSDDAIDAMAKSGTIATCDKGGIAA